MLLNIDPLLTGELLKGLDEMGHSDLVLIADANFPAHRVNRDAIELPGTTVPQVVRAICSVLPLDGDVAPVLMDAGVVPPPAVQAEIEAAAAHPLAARLVDRWEYYDLAAQASVVVATGEMRLWGNVLLAKGLVQI